MLIAPTAAHANGYINGTVYDNGTGLSAAIVSVDGASTTTNQSGNYSLNLSSGTYIVNISHNPVYYPDSSNQISVESNNTKFYNTTLTKKPTGTISGRVCSWPGCATILPALSNLVRWFF